MSVHLVRAAIQALAGTDDGAVQRDGVGFSQADTALGQSLARAPIAAWDAAAHRTGWVLARKYRDQLRTVHGIDVATLPEPPAVEARPQRARWVERDGDSLAVCFGYEPALLADVRATGAHWSRDRRRWEAPLTSRDAVITFAERHGFAVTDDVRALPSGDGPSLNGEIVLDGSTLVITFPYNPAMVEAVRSIPGRTWDHRRRAWTAPISVVRPVRAFAEQYGVALDPAVAALDDVDPLVPVHIRVARRAFLLVFPYERSLIEQAREIPGAAFSSADNAWRAPLDSGAEVLLFARNTDAQIEPSASVLLHEAQNTLANAEASAARDSEYDVPGLGRALYPFQRAGVRYMVEIAEGHGIFGDEPGLGKTAQALATLQVRQSFPALVVAPAIAKINWQREARGWLPDVRIEALSGQTPYRLGDADITIINYDILPHWREALGEGWRGLVLDESHYVMNPRAARTAAAIEIATRIPRLGSRLALTGTAILQSIGEVVPQLTAVGRVGDLGGARGFRSRYGRAPITLNRDMRATCYVRRRKVDVLPDLPPKTWVTVVVEGDPRVMPEYRRAERDIVTYLRDRARHLALASGASDDEAIEAAVRAGLKAEAAAHLVAITHLKQLAARAKMTAARTWVADFLATDRKLVVFAWHRSVVDALHGMHPKAVKIQGGMSDAARQSAIDSFQDDDTVPLVAAQIKAAGLAITLTAASDGLFLEQGWNPAAMDQPIDRMHRIGQTDAVTGWNMVVDGTIDVTIARLIEEKRVLVDAVLDGIETDAEDTSVLADLLYEMATQESLDNAA